MPLAHRAKELGGLRSISSGQPEMQGTVRYDFLERGVRIGIPNLIGSKYGQKKASRLPTRRELALPDAQRG